MKGTFKEKQQHFNKMATANMETKRAKQPLVWLSQTVQNEILYKHISWAAGHQRDTAV